MVVCTDITSGITQEVHLAEGHVAGAVDAVSSARRAGLPAGVEEARRQAAAAAMRKALVRNGLRKRIDCAVQ